MSSPSAQPSSPPSTHQRLREVAAELFASRGYGGTSMSEIADRVGVKKASLYNYYDSKQELLMELLRESLGAWRLASTPSLSGLGSYRERLWAHIQEAADFAAESPAQVAIVRVAATQIGGELGREVQDLLARHRQDYMARLKAFYDEAIHAGEVAPADATGLALATRIFLDGLLSNLIFRMVSEETLQAQLPTLWHLFWRGIQAETDMPR